MQAAKLFHLEFNDLDLGTTITNQYGSDGLVFSKPCTIIKDSETFAHSLQAQELVANEGGDLVQIIQGYFTNPRRHLSMTIKLKRAVAVDGLLRAFDAAGVMLGEQKFGPTAAGCDTARAEIISPWADIASFEMVGGGPMGSFCGIYSIDFDMPQAENVATTPPDFRLVYDQLGPVTPTIHLGPLCMAGMSTSLKARISVFRLFGSQGEILLSMTRPPPAGMTWRFDPPVIHSGVPHFDVEVTATADTSQSQKNNITMISAPIRRFGIEIVATPRSTTAGSAERMVTVPIDILPAEQWYPGFDHVHHCDHGRSLERDQYTDWAEP